MAAPTSCIARAPAAWANRPQGGGVTGRRFLFHDHLGSNVLVTDAAGAVIHRRVFEPFGKLLAETSPATEATAQLFTGQRLEAASGLYDFRARWYDPEAGRFLSVDPVVQDARDPQTVNGYGYVRNNPVNLVDLDGQLSLGWGGSFDFGGVTWTNPGIEGDTFFGVTVGFGGVTQVSSSSISIAGLSSGPRPSGRVRQECVNE